MSTNTCHTECIYLFFLPMLYITAPIVYAMPPTNNSTNCITEILLISGLNANNTHHPMQI